MLKITLRGALSFSLVLFVADVENNSSTCITPSHPLTFLLTFFLLLNRSCITAKVSVLRFVVTLSVSLVLAFFSLLGACQPLSTHLEFCALK